MRFSDLFSNPRRALLAQLTIFYILLGVGVWLLDRWFPSISQYLYSWEAREANEVPGLLEPLSETAFRALQADTALELLVSVAGAVLLMVPVTWAYMGSRRRIGLDQSMVESLLILPIAVAGVVVIVQDSLPLAFSLAGIFAGIQFRSKLKFYADAHFLFIAIGVGLAAGIGALHIALVASFCFNYVTYLIWRLGYGGEAGVRHLRYASDEAREAASRQIEAIHQHREAED